MNESYPVAEVVCRILGFPEEKCTDQTDTCVTMDPIIHERMYAAFKKTHPGWPEDPMSWIVFYPYIKAPAREAEAHLNFPANFDISDEACVLAIFNKMTKQERQELRDRVLDENLQATFWKIKKEGYKAFIDGDRSAPANSDRRIAAALAEWRAARSQAAAV